MRRNDRKLGDPPGAGEGRGPAPQSSSSSSSSSAAAASGEVSSRKPAASGSAATAPRPARDEGEDTVDARSLIRGAVAGLSDAATRGFPAEETIAQLRQECPGWDLYALHAEFETWVRGAPERLPVNWQKAFIGWVRRHHERHRHTLRG